jgi:hypothetical protein
MGKSKSGGSKSKSGGGSKSSKAGDCQGKSKSSGKSSKAGKSKSGSKAKADLFTRHRSLSDVVDCDALVGVRAKLPCACGGKSQRCATNDHPTSLSFGAWW